MPPLEEALHYLKGVVLLLRMKPSGFQWLDLTERGLRRSFWAIVWCFPLMIPNWIWWHGIFADYTVPGAVSGPAFYARMALIELCLWFLPYLTVGLVMFLRDARGRFDVVVIAMNWLNLPIYLVTGVIAILEIVLPLPISFWYYVMQLQLMAIVAAQFMIFYMIAKRQWGEALTWTLASVIPSIIASVWLNDFLGVSL
jgi:hypothetical protein